MVLLRFAAEVTFAAGVALKAGQGRRGGRRCTTDLEMVVFRIQTCKILRYARDGDAGRVVLQQCLGVLDEMVDAGGDFWSSGVDEVFDNIENFLKHAVNATLPCLERTRQRALVDARDTRVFTKTFSIELLHVGTLDKLDKSQGEDVTEESEEEDCFAPGYDGSTPDTSKTNDTFWIVQEAIDTAVGKLRLVIEEKVSEEPAKLAKRLIDADNSPELEGDQGEAKNVTEKCHTIRPVRW